MWQNVIFFATSAVDALRGCHLYGNGPNLLTKIDNRVYKQNQFYLFRASVADITKIMSFYHIKGLLYYFITLFSNIPFIRCFIIQSYTLKWYLLHIKIIYYLLPIIINNSHNNPHRRSTATTHNHRPPPHINHQIQISANNTKKKKKNSNKHYNQY